MHLPPTPTVDWPDILNTLVEGHSISTAQAHAALHDILGGQSTFAQTAGFLVALRAKGETSQEVVGLSDAMLEVAAPLELPADTIDIVGTGGSTTLGAHSFNVSTMASIVAAAAGAVVCKHGNRKASSSSGSTDVLEALGISVELDGPAVRHCIDEAGVGFAFARVFHPAMRYVGSVRAELGIATVFNLLGPISHPGRVRRQVLGVAKPDKLALLADVLVNRGMDRALVVHGSDGLDEITLSGPTQVIDVTNHESVTYEITPSQLGLPTYDVEQLKVGDEHDNARIAREILDGKPGPHRDLVLANAGAGVLVAGLASSLAEGVAAAGQAIDSGAASSTLDRLIGASHRNSA